MVLSILAFLGFFVVYCLRVNLSVAIVAMVNTSYIKQLEAEAAVNASKGMSDEKCEVENHNETRVTKDVRSYSSPPPLLPPTPPPPHILLLLLT